MFQSLATTKLNITGLTAVNEVHIEAAQFVYLIGMYRIPIFQIQPEPDLAGFMNSNPAGAGAGFAKSQHQR